MKVETTRFGVVEIDEASLVSLPGGLLGFEDYRQYCLIQHRPTAKFKWLQSIEEPSLAFVVVDPSEHFEDYEIEIGDSDIQKIQLCCAEDAIVLVIVSIRDGGKSISANLAAPIVVNSKNLTAAQIVLQDERYETRHPLSAAQARHKAAA
ncbi:MAG: flagellar assembly protein FliW [Armatimonadota bacterium]|jgi:flagellar assembly factor FliW